MPNHESGPEDAHDRAVRKAREQLRVDRYFGDADGVARALARLAELGVDEAGDGVGGEAVAL